MKDKGKQINDLANTLYNRQDKYDLSNPFEVAKCVIDLGYRNCKDKVVLSREEYESLYTQEQYDKVYEQVQADFIANNADGGASCHLCMKVHEEKGSKETADKIYRELQGHGTTYVKKWIEKEFGVEVKE